MMILNVFLFLLSIVLVSSNNGSPSQTYPFYQQNGYPTQPSDIAPYLQNMMVQNQSPQPNLSPSNLRQMLINKLLSNQPLQTNFNPNAGSYGLNSVGYPSNPIAANNGNVYYGAPVAEHYQTSTAKEETTKVPNTEGKRKKHKRRRSKSRRKHDEDKNNTNDSIEKVDDTEDNEAELSEKPKKRSRKRKNGSRQDSSTTQTEDGSRKHSRSKKHKNKDNEEETVVDDETKVENPRPRRRRKKKPKSDSDNGENVPSVKVVPEQSTPSKASKVKQEDLNIEKEGITKENRVARNSKPETNDLTKLIPNMPEGFANTFNFNGLPQFQNNPAMSSFFANYENIYQSMITNQESANVKRNNKLPANKTKPEQRRKPVVKSKNSTVTANAPRSANSSTHAVTPKVNVTAKNKTIHIVANNRPNIDLTPKNESLKSNDEPSKVEAVTEQVPKNDDNIDINGEVIENDKIDESHDGENIDFDLPPDPDYSKGYIDDYYPLFADSMVNTANNKEVYIKNLGDTKYYYAVDKGNNDPIGRMRFESFTLPERVPKDYEKNKKYDEIEMGDFKNTTKAVVKKEKKEEKMEFRSPPLLESPDFQTRKVEIHQDNTDQYYNFSDNENDDINHRYIGDKSSTYSGVKTLHDTSTNDNAIKTNDKQRKDIETIFARSKVVKYGPDFQPKDSISAGTNNQDMSRLSEDGITYVLATSLDKPEFYW